MNQGKCCSWHLKGNAEREKKRLAKRKRLGSNCRSSLLNAVSMAQKKRRKTKKNRKSKRRNEKLGKISLERAGKEGGDQNKRGEINGKFQELVSLSIREKKDEEGK